MISEMAASRNFVHHLRELSYFEIKLDEELIERSFNEE
jgi:hypothetical protein